MSKKHLTELPTEGDLIRGRGLLNLATGSKHAVGSQMRTQVVQREKLGGVNSTFHQEEGAGRDRWTVFKLFTI